MCFQSKRNRIILQEFLIETFKIFVRFDCLKILKGFSTVHNRVVFGSDLHYFNQKECPLIKSKVTVTEFSLASLYWGLCLPFGLVLVPRLKTSSLRVQNFSKFSISCSVQPVIRLPNNVIRYVVDFRVTYVVFQSRKSTRLNKGTRFYLTFVVTLNGLIEHLVNLVDKYSKSIHRGLFLTYLRNKSLIRIVSNSKTRQIPNGTLPSTGTFPRKSPWCVYRYKRDRTPLNRS